MFNKTADIDLTRAIRDGGSDVPIMLYALDKSFQVKTLAGDARANYVTEHLDALRDWLEKVGI